MGEPIGHDTDANNTFPLVVDRVTLLLWIYIVATAYHYGFWGEFGVNVFQYTSLTDLVKLVVWPLLAAVVGYAIAMVLDNLTGLTKFPWPKPVEGQSRWQRFRAICKADPAFLPFTLVICVLVASVVYYRSAFRWVLLSMLIGLIASKLAVDKNVKLVGIHSSIHRGSIAFGMIVPCVAWGVGYMDAENIENGVDYTQALISPHILVSAGLEPNEELRYLANTGSYNIFLVGSGPEVLILPNSEVSYIQLLHKTKTANVLKN